MDKKTADIMAQVGAGLEAVCAIIGLLCEITQPEDDLKILKFLTEMEGGADDPAARFVYSQVRLYMLEYRHGGPL